MPENSNLINRITDLIPAGEPDWKQFGRDIACSIMCTYADHLEQLAAKDNLKRLLDEKKTDEAYAVVRQFFCAKRIANVNSQVIFRSNFSVYAGQ